MQVVAAVGCCPDSLAGGRRVRREGELRLVGAEAGGLCEGEAPIVALLQGADRQAAGRAAGIRGGEEAAGLRVLSARGAGSRGSRHAPERGSLVWTGGLSAIVQCFPTHALCIRVRLASVALS
eukprot:440407-Prymnesium_polylepis.1